MAGEIKGKDLPQGDNNEGDTPATKMKGGSKGNLISGDNVEHINKEVFKSAEALAQAQLADKHCMPALYVASLPKVIKRRLKALKKLQVEVNHLEAAFFEELHKLECQYQAKYQSLYDKRAEIVNAKVEPTDEECEWPEDSEDPLSEKFQGLSVEEKEHLKSFGDAHKFDESIKGVPEFWTMIFKNTDVIRSMVQPHDWPIMKHLQDIQLFLNENKSFRLDFVFEDNEFFTNKVLSKTYYMRIQPDEENPILYEGPEVYKCEGSPIQWKPGKDVTVRLVKKVQKHKCRGTKRVLTKTVPNDSFFNFFNPPLVKEDEEMDEDTEVILESDFEIGQFFRERIIPRAVLYYTGESVEEEYEDDCEDDEEEEDDEELDEN